jgi:hypothetical protein
MAARRLIITSSVVLAAAILTVWVSPSHPAFARFSGNTIAFRYPSEWSVRPLSISGTFGAGLAKISSQGFTVPCYDQDCWRPRGGRLEPGAVFALWEIRGFRSKFRSATGTPFTIDGLDARLEERQPDEWCRSMEGTESLLVFVDRHPAVVQLTACLRSPTEPAEMSLRALLASVDFSMGQEPFSLPPP